MLLLVICEILGHFVNTLTPDDKYSLRNSEPLLQPIQTQKKKQNYLKSKKKKKDSSQLFAAFLNLTLDFKYFLKKDDPHGLCTYEITDCERLG